MDQAYVEHVNVTVKDVDLTAAFLMTALPDWRVRGQGAMDWFGKRARWLHVGSDASYVALVDGGEGNGLHWKEHRVGVKHVGIVVPSVDAVVARLAAAGFPLDHWGGAHPHRQSVYVIERDDLQFEFVEYRASDPAQRNDYAL